MYTFKYYIYNILFIYLFPCLYIYIIYLDISEGQLLCFRCSYIQAKGWNYGNKSIRRDIPYGYTIYLVTRGYLPYLVTRGYLPLGYLLILAFLHVQILQPLQHFVCSVKWKQRFAAVLAHSCVICICIYRIFCYLSCEAPVRSKVVSLLLVLRVPSYMIFPNSLVKLAWLPKWLRHTKPPKIGH